MTDDGQAQSSLQLFGRAKGAWGRQGFLPPSISKRIGFAMSKLCRTRPQPGMCFLKHWKNCRIP